MRRGRMCSAGPIVAAFGVGLIVAQILPHSVLLILVAASLICIGIAWCRR